MFGKKKDSSSGSANKGVFEFCEINITEPKYKGNSYIFRFYAKAVSPKEAYTAGISADCQGRQPYSDDKTTQMALNRLKVQLVSEGWELLTERGTMWYSLKFKRPYRS